jgi:signal transduction histidine kinase/HAMP domain-containing protein
MKVLNIFLGKSSIKTKITSAIILVVSIIAIFIILYFPSRQEKQALRGLEAKTMSLADMLAYNVSPGLEFEDLQSVEEAIQGAKRNKDLSYIIIYDSKEQIFASHNLERGKEVLKGKKITKSKSSITMGMLNVFTPILSQGKRVGYLVLGMSLSDLKKEAAHNRRLTFLVSLLIILFGILIANYLSNLLTAPILRLKDAARKLSDGDTQVKVEIKTQDEIGFLAKSFNEMTDSLYKSQQDLLNERNLLKENYIKLESAKERLRLVNEIGKKINSILDIDSVLSEVVKLIKVSFDFYCVAIGIVEGEYLIIWKTLGGKKKELIPKIEKLKIGKEGIMGWVAGNGKPLLVPDVSKDPRYFLIEELSKTKSEVCVPIISQGKVIGDLDVQSDKVDAFSLNDLDLLQSIASQIAIALANAKLFEELKKAYNNLKNTEAQLIQQEKMASVGQLAAGVAHELNNPLGGILGYSQLALERVSKKSVKDLNEEDLTVYSQYLKDIIQQSQRSKAIVQNLLKFARASTKDVFKPIDVNSILEDTFSFTRHHLEMGNIKLINNLSPSLTEIMGNATQLQQVFTNIILNALQAMPQGGDLKVSTDLIDEKPQKMIQITFSDTGYGIPKENLDKVFEPFFTTKEVGEGTGLGLSVSYGIIKDHKGEILVESEVGKGSTFIISIPVLLKNEILSDKKEVMQTEA